MKRFLEGWLVFITGAMTWALYIVIAAPLWVLGLFVVGMLAATKQIEWRPSKLWPYSIYAWKPRWAYLWGNEEDGVDGSRGYQTWPGTLEWQNGWWLAKTNGWSYWRRVFTWAALRNPICNLRFIKPFGFKINRNKIRWWGNSANPREDAKNYEGLYWFLCEHGLYTGFFAAWEQWYVRIGWNIFPDDVDEYQDLGYRAYGAGFKLQFGRIK